MAKRAKTTDHYFKELVLWRDELSRLREILSTTNLEETLKWGIPCYVQHGENIVGLAGYKSYFGLWFYQGALLSDPKKLLINAQEGKTRALRQWRMTSMKEIKSTTIKSYVKEATTLAAAGEKISPDRKSH